MDNSHGISRTKTLVQTQPLLDSKLLGFGTQSKLIELFASYYPKLENLGGLGTTGDLVK